MTGDGRCGRYHADETGSIRPLVAVVLALLCGFAGLGIDLGQVYLDKRRVQSAVDLAARAAARAVLRKVASPWNAASKRSVRLHVTTGAAFLAIGQVAAGALELGSLRPTVAPATILQAPLVTVTARAVMPLGSSTQSVTFAADDIWAERVRTVSTNALASSLAGSLLSTLGLQFNGIALPTILDLGGAVSAALSAAAPPIDSLLFAILKTTGVTLGSAEVAVTGTRCGGAVLVQ